MASAPACAVTHLVVMEDFTREACYRAGQSRDPRFDGRFFTGVTSTGIYCRPICPARTPKFENCRYFLSAAAAQDAGFRPCLRCRPEVSPEFAFWRGTSNTVSRALGLIADGGIDCDTSVDELAERLGVGERQLRRLFRQHLGASPISVIQTRRVLFAKQLIHETGLPMSEVALAAGFGSIRRFNDTFRKLYNRPPSTLRRAAPEFGAAIALQLSYRPPYDWDAMLAFFAARAIPGVELVENGRYHRTARVSSGGTAVIEVAHSPERNALRVKVQVSQVADLSTLVARVRRVFDVGADIATIDEHLAQDPMLAPLVAKRPGLRSPGGWDGFELAVRAVLGQQVSVAAARTLAGRLVGIIQPVPVSTLTHVFPTAAEVAAADLDLLGMPASRKRTLKALAEAAVSDPKLFERSATLEESVARLRAIHGIGEWTAQYIALRALREPDAFPASDLGLLRGAANGSGVRPNPAQLQARAEPWRPWRAYAAQHLWNS